MELEESRWPGLLAIYLTVMVHDNTSTYNTAVCGVPQGSVLRRIRFLLYINDLFHGSNVLSIILFADDTNIFFVIMTWLP